MKNISKADLLALVDEVKKDLKDIAAKEASKLSKADAPPPVEGSASAGSASGSPEGSSSSSSASPEGSSSGGSPDAGGPPGAPPAPEASAAPPPPPGPEGSAPPPGPEGSAPPPGGEQAPAGPSFEELVSLYTALKQSAPQDFEAHVQAIQAAMQAGGEGGPEGSAPPPPGPEASAPPPGPEGSAPPPAMKKEVSASASPEGSSSVSKSEVEALRAELKKAQETIEGMGKSFEQFLTIPQRKAVTGLTVIPFQPVKKSEPEQKKFGEMTEAEVKKALNDVVKSPKLSKADREYVNGYLLNPTQYKVDGLEAIFTKAK